MGNWIEESMGKVRLRGLFLGAALAVSAGCSGGGGGSGSLPDVSFSFAGSSGIAPEGGAGLTVTVELSTTRASLGEDVTVEVVDLATGTATAAGDYAAFGTQVLTFPAASVHGALRSVTLTALADNRVEGGDETVNLRLRMPSQGIVRGTRNFVASIDDQNEATVEFTTGASAPLDESPVDHDVSLVLDLAPGDVLEVDSRVRVSDSGLGSATAGSDYVTFSPRDVSFPAGSLDGAMRTVSLRILDDSQAELDETTTLSLDSPAAGTRTGAVATHEVTIPDDDSGTDATFGASAGATGTEDSLDHDDLLDLGSASVGAGPNAGTRLRVTNLGDLPMGLGAPVLTGDHPEDFVLEIELAPMLPPSTEATPEVQDLGSPLTAAAEAYGPGLALTLDPALLVELESTTHARLHGFPVPGVGDVTLELERAPLPIAPGAVLHVDGEPVPGGLEEAARGLSIWRGSALELPGSRAFVAFSDSGPNGYLELPEQSERVVHLFSEGVGAETGALQCRVVHEDDLLALGMEIPSSLCGGELLPPGEELQSLELGASPPPAVEALTAADCRLAIETDHQLYQRFGSVPATTDYVTQLIAAVSDQYFTDVQTTLSIAYLGVYSSAGDPWSSQDGGGDAGDLLDEFQAAWNTSGWPAGANLAHFISGASLGGGVAYVNVLCNSSFGYGVSGNIAGNIDWGTWSGAPGSFTWDFVVVAHELGHNFGASHTHSYCPPIDVCYSNCESSPSCSQGTIMSYCHTCGGMDNIDLNFHPQIANVMRQRVQSSCLGNSALAGGDYVQYRVRFDPRSATGQRTAELEFAHDAANQPQPFRVRLQGTGN